MIKYLLLICTGFDGGPLERPYSKCLLFFPPYSRPQELSSRLDGLFPSVLPYILIFYGVLSQSLFQTKIDRFVTPIRQYAKIYIDVHVIVLTRLLTFYTYNRRQNC